MEKTKVPDEPNVVLRLLSFLLGFLLFLFGLIIFLLGLFLWKWISFPEMVFVICAIPVMICIYFLGYGIYGNQEKPSLTQHKFKKAYLKHEHQQKKNGDIHSWRLSNGRRECVNDGNPSNERKRTTITPVPGGREIDGEIISGYYIENSGSADF